MHKARGLDGRERVHRIVDVLAPLDADIIALQEVVSIAHGAREADQARYLAEELGMHLSLGANRKLRGGLYGNVLLARHPIHMECNFDITVGGREERGCLRADVNLHGCLLHVYNIHLGTAFLERRHQARRLLTEELLQHAQRQGPRLVLGDFNEWTRGLVTRMLREEFQFADLGRFRRWARSYPGVLPLLHLDHIYYDLPLELTGLRVHMSPLSLIASDHLPLVADFRLSGI